MTDPDVRVLAWCGNSVYHDECDQGVYDDRCGACRRMFERLSAHELEAVETLQTALRQQIEEWRALSNTANHKRNRAIERGDGVDANAQYAREHALDFCADQLDAMLPALEPTK